ncbi:MAG: hypothetical protein ABI635_08435 [Actinomycetota bacterium]
MNRDSALEATMLLCDWAEALQGKLYVMGGGWTQLTLNNPTVTGMTLAITIAVPWDRTNMKLPLLIELVTEDGAPVVKEDGEAVLVEGQIEAGRPPGSKPGASFVSPLAIRVGGFTLEPGAYSWRLKIGDEELAHASFTAIRGSLQEEEATDQ